MFIKKVFVYKILGIKSPLFIWLGIDLRKQSLKWYWKESKDSFKLWNC